MREQVIKTVEKEKLIVIMRGVAACDAADVTEALYAGGIRLLEVTYSADGNVSDEETAAVIEALAKRFEGRMYIGAGTVLNEKQVRLTKQAGGKFIISPNADADVIKETVSSGLVSIPGVFTPTEIVAAHKAGADFVKIFPIGSLGPDYIKAVKAPLSNIRMLAVGGITPDDISKYLAAGADGFGIGSNIVDKKLIAEKNFAALTELAKKYTEKSKISG